MDTTLFQDKHAAYQQLIARVQASYPAYQESTEYEKGQLVWCKDCQQEINLWSYWQGSLDAKIMLVGQDWGCPFDKVFLPTMAQIQKVIKEALDIAELNEKQSFYDITERALDEAKAAIEKVLAGAKDIELTPQNQQIRKLQHELVEQHNLASKSVGEGENRHLRIVGGQDYQEKTGS